MNFFNNEILMKIVIVVLSICGFAVAKHIRNHKTKNTPLICPRGFDCHDVVHSDYSKFLGMPTELLGMTYYGISAFTYFIFIFFNNSVPTILVGVLLVVSLSAVLFSLYLLSVQFFILKKSCSWCIISTTISVLMFILSFLLLT